MSNVSGYTVNRKNADGKLEKVSKLFANADGSFSNKKDGVELKLSGKYPDLLINGQQYGKVFQNQSKATGKNYFVAKNAEEGDLLIFEDTPRAPGAPGAGGKAPAGKSSYSNRPSFQKK